MKNKLTKIRYDLDKLDVRLLNLIKKRTMLVEKVLKTKKYKNQIIDKKRIRQILRNIRKKSLQRKIDPEITKIIWTSMIRAYVKYEFKRFNKK
tara:strand:- start:22 stop:300 length:279 start_codon:yes stop_codon:yes gene_type:complete